MSDFNTRDYETKPLGSRSRSYSKEEAAQAPNQWWDFLDLFRNVPERRIENPYDYDWAKRPEQVEANYNPDGSFVSVPNVSFTSYNIPRYTREGVLYWTTRKDTDPSSPTYGQAIPDVKEYNQNRPWYRSLPYGLGGEKQGDISDYALASFIFNEGPSVAAPFIALKTAKPQTQNIVMKGKYEQKVTIPLNEQGLKDARTLSNALSKDIDTIQSLSRFKNTRPKGIIPSVVTGMVTKDDPVAYGVQEFTPGTIQGADGQPYALQSTDEGAIEPGDSVGGHLGYYNPNFPPTKIRDLDLYAKPPEDFMPVRNFEDALQAADESLAEFKGKRWPGLDLKIGNEYVHVFRDSGGVKILPYNKWHQLKKNPFKVPPDVIKDLKQFEDVQLDVFGPPTTKVTVGSGQRVDKPIITRYPTGTVDKFVKHVNDQIAWQRENQRLDKEFGEAVLKTLRSKTDKELAELGIPPEIWKFDDPSKGPFMRDISHATARASGGPGYTFLEAWWSNQKRGSAPILQNHILQRMGIPTNWREYFERWYQEQGSGEPVTDLGKLADISIDDYFAVEKGEALNKVKLRRKTINHLIQRQIENPATFMQPGNIGETIGDDFEMLVRQSKGYDLNTDLSSIEYNLKEFDLRYRAATYGQREEARAEFIKEKDLERFKSKAERDIKKDKVKQRKNQPKPVRGQKKLDLGDLSYLDKWFPSYA